MKQCYIQIVMDSYREDSITNSALLSLIGLPLKYKFTLPKVNTTRNCLDRWMDDERFLTLIRAPCFPQVAEAGGTCMGQSCAGAPRMEAPHLHLAARRCCPPSSKHDQPRAVVLIGLRLEQQFRYGMHSCRNLTPPGLSRTMSDLDLHSRFLTVRIGIIYLVSGVGGSVLSSLFIRNTISVGASGALFGLLGAMLSELFTNWTVYSVSIFNT